MRNKIQAESGVGVRLPCDFRAIVLTAKNFYPIMFTMVGAGISLTKKLHSISKTTGQRLGKYCILPPPDFL